MLTARRGLVRFDIATTYGFFFPCEAPKVGRGPLRDELTEGSAEPTELPTPRQSVARFGQRVPSVSER